MPKKLSVAPAILYIKVERVPPSKADKTVRITINKKQSLTGRVNNEMMVIKLASPNLAPGGYGKWKWNRAFDKANNNPLSAQECNIDVFTRLIVSHRRTPFKSGRNHPARVGPILGFNFNQ